MNPRKIKNFRMYESKFEDLVVFISSSEFYQAYGDYINRSKFTQKEIDDIREVLPDQDIRSISGLKIGNECWTLGNIESDYITPWETSIFKTNDEWFFVRIQVPASNRGTLLKYWKCDQLDSLIELIKNPNSYFNI